MISLSSNIYFSCKAAVRKLGVYLTWARFSYIYISCLSALTNPDVYLSWAKLSSSLIDIKICHNQWNLDSASQKRSFIGSYNNVDCIIVCQTICSSVLLHVHNNNVNNLHCQTSYSILTLYSGTGRGLVTKIFTMSSLL